MFELGPPCVSFKGVEVYWIGLWIRLSLKLECGNFGLGGGSLLRMCAGEALGGRGGEFVFYINFLVLVAYRLQRWRPVADWFSLQLNSVGRVRLGSI